MNPADLAKAARSVLRADGIDVSNESDAYVLGRLAVLADSLADYEHPFQHCMTNIAPKANVDNPEAFCAALVKKQTGEWPGKKKK